MATRKQFEMTVAERQVRQFSETFKRQKVREIESGRSRMAEVCRQYEVSKTAVYRWLKKFGKKADKPERVIIEQLSDTQELLRLKKQVADLERLVGQKQVLLEFKDKMIELAELQYGVDIKKKFSTEASNSTGNTAKGSPLA